MATRGHTTDEHGCVVRGTGATRAGREIRTAVSCPTTDDVRTDDVRTTDVHTTDAATHPLRTTRRARPQRLRITRN